MSATPPHAAGDQGQHGPRQSTPGQNAPRQGRADQGHDDQGAGSPGARDRSAGRSSDRRPRPARQEARGSTLIPLGILILGIVEIGGLIWLGSATSLWWPLLVVLIGWIAGVACLVAAGQQSFVRLRSLVRAIGGRGDVADHLSRPAFTLLAAACFFFPGMLTDVIALVLLVVPLQRRVARSVGGSGAEQGRRVLYRQSRGGVIDGEIVIDAQRTDGGSHASSDENGTPPAPRIITQD